MDTGSRNGRAASVDLPPVAGGFFASSLEAGGLERPADRGVRSDGPEHRPLGHLVAVHFSHAELAGGELENFFNTLSFGSENWFYFEPMGGGGNALCTDHAEFYVNHYLSNVGSAGCPGATDPSAEAYGRVNGSSPWIAVDAYAPTYYCATGQFYPLWGAGFGASILRTALREDEVNAAESYDSNIGFLEAQSTMRVGSSRLATCGF